MIYITGDTHADFSRFADGCFPQQTGMTKDDYVIVTGDFGGVWDESKQQSDVLDWLDARPFTTLFIGGNHENYDLLAAYPVGEWHGGKVQFIRPGIIHLMRGQIFDIGGNTFFTMGGAACHDIYNGVLDTDDPEFETKFRKLQRARKFFRINHLSWWAQELPTEEEILAARETLIAHGKKVDFVISHCAPTQLQRKIQARTGDRTHPENALTAFLQWIYDECEFKHWYCGHYHKPMNVEPDFHVLYEKIAVPGDAENPYSEESGENGYTAFEEFVAALLKNTPPDHPDSGTPETTAR